MILSLCTHRYHRVYGLHVDRLNVASRDKETISRVGTKDVVSKHTLVEFSPYIHENISTQINASI